MINKALPVMLLLFSINTSVQAYEAHERVIIDTGVWCWFDYSSTKVYYINTEVLLYPEVIESNSLLKLTSSRTGYKLIKTDTGNAYEEPWVLYKNDEWLPTALARTGLVHQFIYSNNTINPCLLPSLHPNKGPTSFKTGSLHSGLSHILVE